MNGLLQLLGVSFVFSVSLSSSNVVQADRVGIIKEVELLAKSFHDASSELPCELPSEDIRSLSEERLQKEYVAPGRPVRLTHATDGWAAINGWTKAGFLERFGNYSVTPQNSQAANLPGQRARLDTFDRMFGSSPSSDAVDNIRFFLRDVDHPEILAAVAADVQWPARGDWPPASLQRIRGLRALSISGMAASNDLHHHAAAWQAQVQGLKLWWLVQPDLKPSTKTKTGKGENQHSSSYDEFSHWGVDTCSYLHTRPAQPYLMERPKSWRCVLGPGSAVYIPDNYFHGTCALSNWTVAYGAQGDMAPLEYIHSDGTLSFLNDAAALLGDDDAALGGSAVGGGGYSLAHWAAMDGHATIIAQLIKLRAPVSGVTQRKRMQPIHFAAERGHSAVIELLVSRRAEVEATQWEKQRPVHLAARNGFPQVLEELAEHGARVTAVDYRGDQPLHVAAVNGHVAAVKMLIKLDARVSAATKKKGSQPLHMAAMEGHVPVAKLLITRRSSVTALQKQGAQPIQLAAQYGHTSVVKLLMERKASIFVTEKQKGEQPIHSAALKGHARMIKFLAMARACPSTEDRTGAKPMHMAAEEGHTAALRMLQNFKADTTVKQAQGVQPIHFAAKGGHGPAIELLLRSSASVADLELQEMQALHVAAQYGHAETVRLLVRLRAGIGEHMSGGRQPLHLAAQHNQTGVISALAELRANVQAVDGRGAQAIEYAREHGHTAAMEALASAELAGDKERRRKAPSRKTGKKKNRSQEQAPDVASEL